MEKTLKKKYIYCVLISSLFFLAFATNIKGDSSYTDPADDVYCISALQYILLVGDMDMPEDISSMRSILDDVKTIGEISTGPNSIDIITIDFVDGTPNSTIQITMEGDLADSDFVQILAFGENADGDELNLFFSLSGAEESYGFVDPITGENNESYGAFVDNIVAWEYPANLLDLDEADLVIVAMTMEGDPSDPTNLQICMDMYPDSSFLFIAGSYEGLDPITEFFDTISSIIFWFLCGRLPYIYFMILLVSLAKILMDRKNRIMRYSGMVVMGVSAYSLIWYTLQINLLGDPLLGWSIPSYMDLVMCLGLLSFAVLQFANNYKILDDNVWLLTLALSTGISQAILYITPIFYYSCGAGDVMITIVFTIMIMIVVVIGMFISEKYSKARLP